MLASSSALDLSNSNYYGIPSQIPPGESYLDLSRNKLTILRRHEFLSMTNLTVLHLSVNQIASVEDGAFAGLSKLELLWLFYNKLTSVPDISPLASLHNLGLSANPIKTIESHDLETSTCIDKLFIAWTEARHPPPLPFCPNMTQLDLSGNKVKHCPLGFFNRLPSSTKLKWIVINCRLSHNSMIVRQNLLFGKWRRIEYIQYLTYRGIKVSKH